MDKANREFPPFPETDSGPAVHTAFFFSSPGSVYRATRVRHAGATPASPRPSSASAISRSSPNATVRLIDDVERTHQAMPGR